MPGPETRPKKPNLRIIDVNLYGTLYTTKLSLHYFMEQNGTSVKPGVQQEDTCLILIGSGAGFLDVPRTPQYCSKKWAVRGIMHALRRTAFYYGSRVNVIAPWYVRTTILSDEAFSAVEKSGVEFATAEDAGRCALRILSDSSINGRSLFVAPRKWAPESGYMDLDLEDYIGEDKELGEAIQADQVRTVPVGLGLFP
jgi:NAD(P)-dependent dehydrogenase (short-subunit alcohol dehydrogenase family)